MLHLLLLDAKPTQKFHDISLVWDFQIELTYLANNAVDYGVLRRLDMLLRLEVLVILVPSRLSVHRSFPRISRNKVSNLSLSRRFLPNFFQGWHRPWPLPVQSKGRASGSWSRCTCPNHNFLVNEQKGSTKTFEM